MKTPNTFELNALHQLCFIIANLCSNAIEQFCCMICTIWKKSFLDYWTWTQVSRHAKAKQMKDAGLCCLFVAYFMKALSVAINRLLSMFWMIGCSLQIFRWTCSRVIDWDDSRAWYKLDWICLVNSINSKPTLKCFLFCWTSFV